MAAMLYAGATEAVAMTVVETRPRAPGLSPFSTGCSSGAVIRSAVAMLTPAASSPRLGRAASVAVGAVVHLGAIVAPQARIPVGWVAVGDPARIYPPGHAEAIQAALAKTGWSFLPVIFGVDDAGGRREQLRAALKRYTAAMARHHLQDRIV
jgi:hypothetical protein